MKKVLSLILAVLIAVMSIPFAYAATQNYNGFVYSKNGDGTCTITSYTDFYAETVTIPEKIGNLTVTAIGSYAFQKKSSIQVLRFPDTVASIGAYAFYSCKNLETVRLGTGVKSIGAYAFNSCSSITGINLRNVEAVGEFAFMGCSSLTDLYCGEKLLVIGKRAFSGCEALSYIQWGETIKAIGEYAFSGCHGLTELEFPDSLTSIGASAFRDCTAVEDIIFGNGSLKILDYAFENCTALSVVTIPETVVSVGTRAFAFRGAEDVKSTHPVKIYCYSGTAGFKYAVENNAPAYIIDLQKNVAIFGDLSGDGNLTTTDARLAMNYAAGHYSTPDEETLFMGDLNQNGYFDLEDARTILLKVSKIA